MIIIFKIHFIIIRINNILFLLFFLIKKGNILINGSLLYLSSFDTIHKFENNIVEYCKKIDINDINLKDFFN